jgi:hypothetical protein
MKLRRLLRCTSIFTLLLIFIAACNFPLPSGQNGEESPIPDSPSAIPATTDLPSTLPVASLTFTPLPPTATSVPLPTASPTHTATATAPPDGVSLNCDGTYQRVRITDHGASGKTISVDDWDGSTWVNVWNVSSGDPNLRQILPEAGHYEFAGCRNLVIVPMRSSGPHLWLELGIHVWNGAGLTQVYFNEGYYGEWLKAGDVISFREASSLGGSPLSPCEWTTLEHEWDETAFVQVGSVIAPVPACTPTVP